MQAFATLRSPMSLQRSPETASNNWTVVAFAIIAILAMMAAFGANAAGVTGTALKPAFDTINDIAGGYGKQLLVLVGFVSAGFAILASNAASAILKYIGYIIFLGVGLTAALGLSGAVV